MLCLLTKIHEYLFTVGNDVEDLDHLVLVVG